MRTLGALLLLAIVGQQGTAAQVLASGMHAHGYALGESEGSLLRSLRLVTIPIQGRVPLGSALALSVTGGYADAQATLRNGGSGGTSGFLDTRVSLELDRGGFTLTGAALLPTGEVVSSTEEAAIVGFMSADVLPFGVTQWGTGGGFSGDLAYAFQAADLAFRLAAGGAVHSSSSPLGAAGYTFEPGAQIRGRVGIDIPAGEAGIASLLVGYQRFGTDAYQSQPVYTAGTRLEVVGSYSFPLGVAEGGLVYGGVYRLGRAAADVPAGMLATLGSAMVGVGGRAPRTAFFGGTELRVRRGSVTYAPRADLRLVRSRDGVGQGWMGSFGGRALLGPIGRAIGGAVRLEPGIALHLGRLVGSDGSSAGVIGWQAGATLRWETQP